MKMPSATWTMIYSSSRRKHNHRCPSCQKTIKEGDKVLMTRVGNKVTRCMHEVCAANPFGNSGLTGQEFMHVWGMEHLAACGWKEAKTFMNDQELKQ